MKGVKGVMGAAAQEGRILAAGKAVTAATRPMALRTTTEQFLANAKRVMGGGDARTVSGFMHMQVGVAQTTPLKAGVEMIAMTVSTGVDVLVDAPATAGRIVDAALRGGVTVAPAPDPITVIDKTARTLSEAASSGRR